MAKRELLNITRCSGNIFHENLRSMIRPHFKKKCLLKCSSFLSSRTIERTRKKKRKLCLLFVILYRLYKNSQKVLLYPSIQLYLSVRGPRACRLRATPLFGSRARKKKLSKKEIDFSTKIVFLSWVFLTDFPKKERTARSVMGTLNLTFFSEQDTVLDV